jgi:hypothetical protein
MNIKKLEDVLSEMRKAISADSQQLREWETRIDEAIADDLMAQINAAFAVAPELATEPGGHDWDE